MKSIWQICLNKDCVNYNITVRIDLKYCPCCKGVLTYPIPTKVLFNGTESD